MKTTVVIEFMGGATEHSCQFEVPILMICQSKFIGYCMVWWFE